MNRALQVLLVALVMAWIIIESRPVVSSPTPLEDQSITLEYQRYRLRLGLRPQDFTGARP